MNKKDLDADVPPFTADHESGEPAVRLSPYADPLNGRARIRSMAGDRQSNERARYAMRRRARRS